MVRRWQLFGTFLHPVFSVSRVQHVSDLHPKFALKPHHMWKYATAQIMRGKKRRWKERRKKPQDEDIMSASATQGGHKKADVAKTDCKVCNVENV